MPSAGLLSLGRAPIGLLNADPLGVLNQRAAMPLAPAPHDWSQLFTSPSAQANQAQVQAFDDWRQRNLAALGAAHQRIKDIAAAYSAGKPLPLLSSAEIADNPILEAMIGVTEAWHGSPHLWPAAEGAPYGKVDLSKVGTGEGAQAYGWGFYAGGKKGTAEYYKDSLAGFGWKTSETAQKYRQGTIDALRHELRYRSPDEIMALNKQYADAARETGERTIMSDMYDALASGDVAPRGSLYRLELQPEESDYLHWDKPLSEQSDKVKAAISKVMPDMFRWGEPHMYRDFKLHHLDGPRGNRVGAVREEGGGRFVAYMAGRDGELGTFKSLADAQKAIIAAYGEDAGAGLYKGLAERLGSDRAASLALRDAGIPGIKYLDQGSRGAGEGSHNYVLFDPEAVKVLERK